MGEQAKEHERQPMKAPSKLIRERTIRKVPSPPPQEVVLLSPQSEFAHTHPHLSQTPLVPGVTVTRLHSYIYLSAAVPCPSFLDLLPLTQSLKAPLYPVPRHLRGRAPIEPTAPCPCAHCMYLRPWTLPLAAVTSSTLCMASWLVLPL